MRAPFCLHAAKHDIQCCFDMIKNRHRVSVGAQKGRHRIIQPGHVTKLVIPMWIAGKAHINDLVSIIRHPMPIGKRHHSDRHQLRIIKAKPPQKRPPQPCRCQTRTVNHHRGQRFYRVHAGHIGIDRAGKIGLVLDRVLTPRGVISPHQIIVRGADKHHAETVTKPFAEIFNKPLDSHRRKAASPCVKADRNHPAAGFNFQRNKRVHQRQRQIINRRKSIIF